MNVVSYPSERSLWIHLRTIVAGYNPLAVRHARESMEWVEKNHPDESMRREARLFIEHVRRPA